MRPWGDAHKDPSSEAAIRNTAKRETQIMCEEDNPSL